MSRNVKTSRLTEAALITGILIIFAMVGNFAFPFIDFLYPLPALLLAKRHDYKAAIMALVSAGLIILMLLGIQMGMYYVVLYSPMAAIMGYFISNNKKPILAIAAGSGAYLLSFLCLLWIMQAFLSINLVDYLRETFVESLKIQENLFSNFEGMQEQLEASKETYQNMLEMIILLLPAVIIFASVSMAIINYFVAQKMGKRLNVSIEPMEDFSHFRLPANISLGILIFLAGTYLISMTDFVNSEALSSNIIFIFQILFFIQGLAVVKFMMVKYKITKLLRLIMLILILMNGYLNLMVTMVGLTDIIFDLRKIRNKNRWLN
ncbi:MAG: Membrane protein [Clostridiales bacterium 38_11]|nr:MAG: Membrane protein [Clostridiales bacterium 38_11]HBH12477.1 hypothetical protein [Clostridiales bacterium]